MCPKPFQSTAGEASHAANPRVTTVAIRFTNPSCANPAPPRKQTGEETVRQVARNFQTVRDATRSGVDRDLFVRFEGVLAVLAHSADAYELRDAARNLCTAAALLRAAGRPVEADR